MIIARADKDGKPILMLGLSKHNIGRLELGQPIVINQEKHGEGVPEGWEILLFYGETEQAIFEMFKRLGLIGPDTPVHKDPKLRMEE